MIKFLNDETVAGHRHGAGAIAQFNAATELSLISAGDAIISPIPALVAQSYVGWTRSSANAAGDASYVVLASVTLPAGTMGLNSKLVIILDWDFPDSASTKALAADFGGTSISAISLTTGYIMGKVMLEVQNLNSLSSQKTMNGSSYGVSANPRLSSSVNTANAVAIDFKVKWGAAVASETIGLLGYSIWHYPGS